MIPFLHELKEKASQNVQRLTTRDLMALAGVAGAAVAVLVAFKKLAPKPGSSRMHIHETHEMIVNCMEKAGQSRQPLVVEHVESIEGGGLHMRLVLVSKLRAKEEDKVRAVKNPFLPPFQQGLFIREMGQSHRLLFNKFNIYQQHLLVVTKELQPQHGRLTRQDLKQTILAFKAVKGMFFFNSGPKAGASQHHRHLQVFPAEARDMPIFKALLQHARELKYRQQQKIANPLSLQIEIFRFPGFRFKHGLVLIGSDSSIDSTFESDGDNRKEGIDDTVKLKESSYLAYLRLYKELIERSEEGERREYNLIGCEHFLLMVPRKKGKAFNQISVNAVGFMGEVLFKDAQLMRRYMQEGRQGHHILEDITFKQHK